MKIKHESFTQKSINDECLSVVESLSRFQCSLVLILSCFFLYEIQRVDDVLVVSVIVMSFFTKELLSFLPQELVDDSANAVGWEDAPHTSQRCSNVLLSHKSHPMITVSRRSSNVDER